MPMHKDRSQKRLVLNVEGLAHPSLVEPILYPAGVACMADLLAEHERKQRRLLATLDEHDDPEDYAMDDYHEGYAVYGPLFPHEEGGPVPVLFEERLTAERLLRALDRLKKGHKLYHEAWAAGEYLCFDSKRVKS